MSKREYSLHVYSAGAVAPPLQEALTIFEKSEGVQCRFTAGKPEALLHAIRHNKNGDHGNYLKGGGVVLIDI
jgi:hypothetical protein